jgi:Fe(3+) dicitrate transport protein
VYTDALTGNNRAFDRYGLDTRLTLDHGLFGLDNAELGVRGFHEESDDRRIRATRDQDRTGTNDRHIVDSANSIAFHLHNRIQFSDRLALTPGVRFETYEQKRRVLTSDNETAETSNTEFLPGSERPTRSSRPRSSTAASTAPSPPPPTAWRWTA